MEHNKTGALHLHIGCMYSGKTTSMMVEVDRWRRAAKFTVVARPALDNRTATVTTHAGTVHNGITLTAATLSEIFDELVEYDAIGIDEVQFFPDAIETICRLVAAGRLVVASGLDGTFEGKPFPIVGSLIPLADRVEKHSAICSLCGADANFTLRTSTDTEIIVIGGSDKYLAACRACWLANKRQ